MLVLLLSPTSISVLVCIVDYAPCCFMWRWPIVVLIYLYKFSGLNFQKYLDMSLIKYRLVTFRRPVSVGINSLV